MASRSSITTRFQLRRNYTSSCLTFNGSTAFVDFGTPSNLGVAGNHDYTISAWYNPTSFTNDGAIFSYGNSGASQIISIDVATGGFLKSVHFANDNTSTFKFPTGVWTHVLITHNATTNKETYYINSYPYTTWSPTALSVVSGHKLYMGRASWNGTFTGACSIGICALWNRVLTQAEISEVYNNDVYPTSGLVALEKLNEGSGNTAIDSSTSANNGTITAATYSTSIFAPTQRSAASGRADAGVRGT